MYDSWERMRREAAVGAAATSTAPRHGVISSYDPKRYAVKVKIMPEAAFLEPGESGETGWIPLGTAWSGDGFGDFAPPLIGTQVHVSHQEDSVGAGVVLHQLFDEQHPPLEVPVGERWIVHKSGSAVKFTNDEKLLVNAKTELVVTVGNVTIDAKDGSVVVTVGGATLTMTPDHITSSVIIHAPDFIKP